MIKDNRKPYLLLLPSLLIMVIFVFFPIFRTLIYSLQKFKLTKPNEIEFIGLKNYREIVESPDFHKALMNSFVIIFWVILFVMAASIFVALILNHRTRLTSFLTAVAILPWALPPLVNGIIWGFIFNPAYGLVNKLLLSLQWIQQPIPWTNNLQFLLLIVSIIVSWRVVPFCALIILSSLQNIPKDLYEASSMDGANRIQTFFSITIPTIIPSLVICLTQATLAGINVFDEVIALVGYRQDSQTLLIYNYQNTFSFLNFGYGSAITYLIMIVSGIAGYFYVKGLMKDM